jgi:hypothetical protein
MCKNTTKSLQQENIILTFGGYTEDSKKKVHHTRDEGRGVHESNRGIDTGRGGGIHSEVS